MIEKKTVSMCITSDYCKGWNDAVDSIVRCEKCAFAQKQIEFKNLYVCLQNERFVKKNDYCSYGERKTDNA